MPSLEEEFVTSAQAAEMLGIHRDSVQRLVMTGKLTATKMANRLLIRRRDVFRLKETYRTKPGRPPKQRRGIRA